jgi:ABC-type multidrug transport system fused ATPase/permease subunit
MIEKMMTDLVFFVSIISVFVSSFGIATQATLYPKSPGNLNLVKGIINKAYWPIYGDMKIFDDLDNENCANNPEGCPEPTGVIFSYIALMIYMAIANLLLINLLIAMFRYFFVFFYRYFEFSFFLLLLSTTFERIEENTDIIWRFQRYSLIYEYKHLPILPPPLIIIPHFFSLIKTIFKRISRKSYGIETIFIDYV